MQDAAKAVHRRKIIALKKNIYIYIYIYMYRAVRSKFSHLSSFLRKFEKKRKLKRNNKN